MLDHRATVAIFALSLASGIRAGAQCDCPAIDTTCWDYTLNECFADNIDYTVSYGVPESSAPRLAAQCQNCNAAGNHSLDVTYTNTLGFSFSATFGLDVRIGIPGCLEIGSAREAALTVDTEFSTSVTAHLDCQPGTIMQAMLIRHATPVAIEITSDYLKHYDVTWDPSCPDTPAVTTFCTTVMCEPGTQTLSDTVVTHTVVFQCEACSSDGADDPALAPHQKSFESDPTFTPCMVSSS